MLRTEVLKEWFFPIPQGENGIFEPAPSGAVEQYINLRDGWLTLHPKLPNEVPSVSLCPGKQNGRGGYFVRTEILYK